MISGEDKGRTVLFKYNPRQPDQPNPLAAQTVTLSIHAQIAKLEERLKRTAEISFEKTYEAAKDVMEDPLTRYTSLTSPLTQSEKTAFHVCLLDFLESKLHSELFFAGFSLNQHGKAFAETVSEEMSNRLVRSFIKSRTKVSNATYDKSKAECLVEVVSELFSESFLSDRERIAQTYQRRMTKIEFALTELHGALEQGSGDDQVPEDYADAGLDDDRDDEPGAVTTSEFIDQDNE
jgi:hypothetical protein